MRIRSIKPEYWSSEDVAALPDYFDRLLFIGLWSYVDDNAVGRDNEKLIGAKLFPLEEDPFDILARIRGGLATLSERGLIARYLSPDGKPLLMVTGWHHQKIDKPTRSPLPRADEIETPLTCGNPENALPLPEVSANPREEVARVPGTDKGTRDLGTRDLGIKGSRDQGIKGSKTYGDVDSREEPSLLIVDAEPEPEPPPAVNEFAEFWRIYPRRDGGPQNAQRAWTKARKHTPAASILAGATRYRDDPNRLGQFTAHAATWLNRGSWDDDPLPVRDNGQAPKRAASLIVMDNRERVMREMNLTEETHSNSHQVGDPSWKTPLAIANSQ